jgi:ubiquinone/menaquinone biosynthesis C-methylase UbiE
METVTLPRFVSPKMLASHFHIDKGATVVDYGAGHGTYIPYLAEKVGKKGRVVACEVQRPLVEKIGRIARDAGYDHVLPVWCDVETLRSTRLEDETSDFGVLINTLYQLEDRVTALTEIARTLRQGGIVYVVDWEDSFGGMGPTQDEVMSREATIALFESAYFIYEREYPAGTYHYGLAFRKL